MSVSDNAAKTLYEGASNFVDNTISTDGQSDYTYDNCGALTSDNNKGITSITYDKLGNPLKVYFYNNNQIEYVYTADGIRLKTRYITAVPVDGTSSSETLSSYKILSRDSTEYIGDFVYENGRLKQYNFGSGYVVPTDSTYSYNFYFKDHLGNIRVVTDYAGNIIQTTHYYPYGTTTSSSTQQSTQKYKYNGKELDRTHGLDWYDYGARQYDAEIGRFTSMDPLCEKYYYISPYAYCAGNPIKYIDTDGREVHPAGLPELEMIQRTLPVEARNYVVLNQSGMIDRAILASCPISSYNISCLQEQVANDKIVDVILANEFTWEPGNTKLALDDPANQNPYPMSYGKPDPDFMDPYHYTNDFSTGETGNTGKTLFPDKDGLQNSPDENIKVIINKNLSPQGRAEAYSHEANGHDLLYMRSGYNHKAASHNYKGSQDLNKKLDDLIMRSKIETIENNK
jgi:RHS repeat-associated protein